MSKKSKLWSEVVLLFLFLPLLLAAPLPDWLLTLAAITGVIWCIWLLHSNGKLTRQTLLEIPGQLKWKYIILRMAAFMFVSSLLVALLLPEKLFYSITEHPRLWLGMSAFYCLVSVYPQELIYRHFFFWRYRMLLPHGYFLALNAALFCVAHTLYMNNLVFALTLAGGFLFARTFHKTNSLMVTSIEHSFYGVWLYTVGLGEMLAFPGPYNTL